MKIVCLKGGLGNQMFEYCRYKKLLEKNEEQVYLYIDHRSTKLHGGVQLSEAFGIQLPPVNVLISLFVALLKTCRKLRIFRRLYDDEDPHAILIDDYSQQRQFIGNAHSYLCFKSINESDFSSLIKTAIYPVSVHVRRGDYLDESNIKNFGVCSTEYYRKAISRILIKHPDATFFVFSDDMQWVRENLFIPNVVFVVHENPLPDYMDMYLMTLCKGHIIANSTFSFWGAYLSSEPDNFTIYPQKWFAEPSWTVPDIFPDEWVRQ